MISTIFDILYIILHILITEQRWQRKNRLSRSDQEKLGKKGLWRAMGAWLICHMIYFLFYRKIKQIFLYAAK